MNSFKGRHTAGSEVRPFFRWVTYLRYISYVSLLGGEKYPTQGFGSGYVKNQKNSKK
jgi:hypothetical protein